MEISQDEISIHDKIRTPLCLKKRLPKLAKIMGNDSCLYMELFLLDSLPVFSG